MPNMSGHMAIAKQVSEILNINNDDFYRGNLLPDLYIDKVKSHYKIQGKKYLIPDISRVKKELDLTNMENLGYLTHLLLDKYYLEEYLIDIKDDVFKNKAIYKDYDILNKDIVEYFKIDVPYLESILHDFNHNISNDKLEVNLKCLMERLDGTTKYLEKDKFISFLEKTAARIAKEIKEYIN